MKCWSRSTLGVVIGVLNVVFSIGVAIFVGIRLTELDAELPYRQRNEIEKIKTIFIVVMVFCLISAIISILFVVGIIKRRHKLMLPWLILSAIGFVLQCGRFIFSLFVVLFYGSSYSTLVTVLIVGVLLIGITALILWPLYKLFRDIRKRNIEGGVNKVMEY